MEKYTMKLKHFLSMSDVLNGHEDSIMCGGSKNDIEIHFEPKNKKCFLTIWSDDSDDMSNYEINLKWEYSASSINASMLLFGADLIESCYKIGFDIQLL